MKFKYKVCNSEYGITLDELCKDLNNYGEKGWECVSVLKQFDDYKGTYYSMLLKKPKKEDEIKPVKEEKKSKTADSIDTETNKELREIIEGWQHSDKRVNPYRDWDVQLGTSSTSTDPCDNCPNKEVPEGYIGDWPCQGCSNYKWKLTCNAVKLSDK